MHDQLARQNARLAELAATDELTGVKNRRRFREDLELLFAQSERKGFPLSLIMLDIDHFKQYNDAFGHPAGDEVLRQVGATLRAIVRGHDVVARYGGEEFVVLLPATGANDSVEVAERLRNAIAGHDWPHRPVTASFGVATYEPGMTDPNALVDRADRALYLAKEAGRNRTTHFDQAVSGQRSVVSHKRPAGAEDAGCSPRAAVAAGSDRAGRVSERSDRRISPVP